jgi:pyruvate formate lyase activating enzyme
MGLRVGGLTPLTSVDLPGELAAVVYCQGCPYRCAYCHNAHLIPGRGSEEIPWRAVLRFLETRRGLLDGVVFSGGEPTLQPGLPEAIGQVWRLGFKVGLHTAGPYPQRLRRLIPLLDWVGLDIKALPEDYPSVTGVAGSGVRAWESLRLLLEARIPLEVRTTPMPEWAPGRVDAIARRLADEGVEAHRIQMYRPPLGPSAAIAA